MSPRRPTRRSASASGALPEFWIVAVVAMVVAAAVVVGALVVPSSSSSGTASFLSLNATLSGGPAVAWESSSYFSLNTASPGLGLASVDALVAATHVTYLNYGSAPESVNQSAGLVYYLNGTTAPFTGSNDSAFIRFCEQLHCEATMPVPGEIDDPGAAADTVRYVEQTLGFHPEYWEIGNEPISWTHFGIPWARWSATDDVAPTPLQYAQMVQRYIPAMRSVDPSIRIIGIQSDAGAPIDTAWFQDLVALDGPNLSAVAYHSYAGGLGFPGNDASDFFATLTHPQTFPLNYPTTVGVVRAACPSCSIQVLVGEYNSARYGNFTPLATGYDEAPYIAAGLLQGLRENASRVTLYALQPKTNAGLLDANDAPYPLYDLYATFLPNLTLPHVLNSSIAGGPGGVYELVSHNGTNASVFVVNTNTSFGLRLSLGPGVDVVGDDTVYAWSPGLAAPSVGPEAVTGITTWSIPPEGMLLIDGPVPLGIGFGGAE